MTLTCDLDFRFLASCGHGPAGYKTPNKTRGINNKKHLKNVGPIRHCEPLHAHSQGVARIDVHDDDDDDDDNA